MQTTNLMKNLILKRLPWYLLFGIIIPIFSLDVYGFEFNQDSHIKNITINNDEDTLSFEMLLYAGGTNVNHLRHMIVSLENVDLLSVKNKILDPAGLNINFSMGSLTKQSYQVTDLYDEDVPNNNSEKLNTNYAIFKVAIPEDLKYLADYEIKLVGVFDDGSNTHFSKTSSISGWPNIDIPDINSTTDECGEIEFSWDNDDPDYFMKYKYKKPNEPWTVFKNTDSKTKQSVTFENSTENNNTEVLFKLKIGYGNLLKRSKESNEESGSIPELLDYPSSFSASDNNCDTTIVLDWDWSGSSPEGFYIDYKKGGDWIRLDTLGGSARTFTVNTVITSEFPSNELVSFRIATLNKCGINGEWTITEGRWIDEPMTPTELIAIDTIINGVRTVYVSWVHNAVNETNYKLGKKVDNGDYNYFPINSNEQFYLDNNLIICKTNTYEIFAQNLCTGTDDGLGIPSGNPISIDIGQNLSNTFLTDSNLQISKGYFPNYVQLEWNTVNNSNLIEYFKIHRRLQGSDDMYTQIASTTSGTNLFIDETASAGHIFEYLIIGEAQCLTETSYTDTLKGVGFRSPSAIVNGHVEYNGGVAVEGVKISFESTVNSGATLELDGASSLKLSKGFQKTSNTQDFYFETWIKPKSDSVFNIFEMNNEFNFQHTLSGFNFETSNLTNTNVLQGALIQNEWQHLGLKLFEDSLSFFINGVLADRIEFTNELDLLNIMPISIGENLKGNIDEIRIWNQAPTDSLIYRDYSRFLNGDEYGLVSYLRCDEPAGDYAYDISHIGAVYTKNDAFLDGSITRDVVDKPSTSKLSYIAYTNESGVYSVLIPFQGTGQNFTVTPSFNTHDFSPSSIALFLGDGSTVNNGVNFEDNSSFTVQGEAFLYGSSCEVANAYLFIDGKQVITSDNQVVETGNDGRFTIEVPIGNHSIEIRKTNHEFSKGRFPLTGTYNFQENIENLPSAFIDSTFRLVVGRVVGGDREIKKDPGFGKSKNNIGVAKITFTSTGGCFEKTVYTDSLTGEYQVSLPPLDFIVDIDIDKNIDAEMGIETSELFTVKENKVITTVYDTLFNLNDSMSYEVDSFSFHYQQDYSYKKDPELKVYNSDGVSEFSGDTSYVYVDPVTQLETIVNLNETPLQWPVFYTGEGYRTKTGIIRIFEEYMNKDNPLNIIRDSVPVIDGNITVNSGFTSGDSAVANLGSVNTIDTLKSLVFEFPINGVPNFLENASEPINSYTNILEIYYESSSGEIIHWYPSGGNEPFRGYLLGEVSVGNQFTTNGPQSVDFILRDPPGSGSSATRETGSTSSSTDSWSYSASTTGESSNKLTLGSKFQSGVGVSIETDISLDLNQNIKSEVSLNESGSLNSTITNTLSLSTSGSSDLPGAESDIFIGKSQNVEFGLVKELIIVPDSGCTTFDCYGSSKNGLQLGEKHKLSLVNAGYETYFIYSQNHIKNYLIPALIEKRNATLQSDPLYVSKLSINHVNYGKSNDDPDLDSVSSSTPFEREIDLDNDGMSYTYNPITAEDSLQDLVWTDNHQINLWEEALKENEWEKMIIDDADILDSLKNKELADLEKEYEETIDLYNDLSNAEITFATATHISSLAGAKGIFSGIVSFSVTAATAVELTKITNRYLEYSDMKDRIIDNFDRTLTNYSISGGSSLTNSVSNERVISSQKAFNYDMSVAFGLELKAKVNNTGFESNIKTGFGFKRSRSESTANSTTETTSFTLEDSDEGDYFSVDVYPSLLGYGPIFKLKEGGQTSCPHEDEIVTEYYEPGTVISARTLQRDKPTVTLFPSIVQNVPMDGSAVFNVTLGNISESNDGREYHFQMVSNSNPNGAIVKVDGLSPQGTVAINANSSFNKIITVQKGAGPVFKYDSLLFILTAPCQYESGTGANIDIVDSVYFSAHFIPECTEVELYEPQDQWVLNNSFNQLLPITISDYDINFTGLKRLEVEYKSSSESEWLGFKSFYKDSVDFTEEDTVLISTSSHVTAFDWDVSALVDGNYDLRVKSECGDMVENESTIYSGVIDRINPHAFGSPSPADGILTANEDISITFNENIDAGALTTLNFDIRGVLNGSEIRHQTSVEFDGDSSYIEIPSGINLQSRDFTIEFWAQNKNPHNSVIFSQGSGMLESLRIGTDTSGKVYFEIAGERVSSDGSIGYPEDWHHYSFAYSAENELVEIFVDDVLLNISKSTIYSKYSGSGKIFLGKSTFGDDEFYEGNIHDLRIWNHKRSSAQITAHRNIQVGKENIGLLHNYRMDEAIGEIVTDHVRLRNGILNHTEWALIPGGYAIPFEAIDSSAYILEAPIVSFTDEMDFTIEFWFNGNSSARETLFSNGRGDGLAVDSLESWSVTKYTDGSLHLLHYGQNVEIAEAGSFDGNWHHMAFVVDRGSVLSTYLDGNLTSSSLASNFKEFGASQMTLGSRYYQNGVIKEYDEFFTGSIDEFRIWNLSRTQIQINRDMRFKLQGNEMGLVSYVPFEIYDEDSRIFIENFDDQADTNNSGSYLKDTLTTSSPKIKFPRPVEGVSYTYSVNGDKIIITPTNPSSIENVTLDITVRNVFDLHGNIMQSPETWVVYPDQNQVGWETDLVTIDILKDEGYSFTKKIINSGGASKNFTIENIPNWLTVNVSEGVIEPNSTFDIEFTVNNDVNIGSYKEDIVVLTDFNYPEKLTVDLKVSGTPPNWNVNIDDFETSMSIVGSISINNVVSIDSEDILYAFVGEECRGKTTLEYIPSFDKYMLFMDVFSNTSLADSLTFKIWDASTGSVFVDVLPNDLTFSNDALLGSLVNPIKFEAFSKVLVDYDLNPGWNWISFYLGTPDTASLNQLLSSLNSQDGDLIKTLGYNTFATYNDGYGWVGKLDTATTNVSIAKGYKLKVNKRDTLTIVGDIIDPTDFEIQLNYGWNWIGFVSIRPMSIELALGNLSPSTGDLLKGRVQFSIYDEQLGWIGSLDAMQPGESYMYQSVDSVSKVFTFPEAGAFKMKAIDPYVELTDERWPVDYNKSISNMSAIVELEQCENPIDLNDWYIGFFDGTGTCRSLSTIKLINDEKQLAFVTAVGNDNLNLKPRLLNKLSGREINLEGKLSYKANSIQGKYDQPIVVSLKTGDCEKFATPTPETELDVNVHTQVYPSQFNSELHVKYYATNSEDLTLSLINVNGQTVRQINQTVEVGDNTFQVNKRLSRLANGVYMLKIESSRATEVFKLIKQN